MPTPARFCPAPVPAAAAAATGPEDCPICFSDSTGWPGSRRTRPPSWSVISRSGTGTGLCACACRSCVITPAIWVSLGLSPRRGQFFRASPRMERSDPLGAHDPPPLRDLPYPRVAVVRLRLLRSCVQIGATLRRPLLGLLRIGLDDGPFD